MGKVLRPLVVLAFVSAVVFGLAEAHLLKPGTPKAASGSQVQLGDPYRGETVFQQRCSGCHGLGGKGGGIGPTLAGATLSSAAVQARIDGGGGAMPAGLVSGQSEADVVAYVATIAAQ